MIDKKDLAEVEHWSDQLRSALLRSHEELDKRLVDSATRARLRMLTEGTLAQVEDFVQRQRVAIRYQEAVARAEAAEQALRALQAEKPKGRRVVSW